MADIDLQRFGIFFKGPIEDIVLIQYDMIPQAKYINEIVSEPYNYIEEYTIQKENEASTRRFYVGPVLSKGSYGFVEYILCYDSTINSNGIASKSSVKLVRKRSRRQQHSLFLEACLQHLAYEVLSEAGFSYAVAKVTDIYRLPGGSISFMMEALRDVEKVSDALIESFDMEELLLSILSQIAIFIQCLETKLCMNHRDLKSNNILIMKESIPGENYIITDSWKIYAPRRICIVDFGFACIGVTPPPVMPAILSSGEFFSEDDDCPKKGRDLFQLLSFFYMMTFIRERISNKMLQFLESCINFRMKNEVFYCEYLKSQEEERYDKVYDIISEHTFKSPECVPSTFLKQLSQLYPHICIEL
jgi:serine/threonine protein kinase